MRNPLQHDQFVYMWLDQRWKMTHMLPMLKVTIQVQPKLWIVLVSQNKLSTQMSIPHLKGYCGKQTFNSEAGHEMVRTKTRNFVC